MSFSLIYYPINDVTPRKANLICNLSFMGYMIWDIDFCGLYDMTYGREGVGRGLGIFPSNPVLANAYQWPVDEVHSQTLKGASAHPPSSQLCSAEQPKTCPSLSQLLTPASAVLKAQFLTSESFHLDAFFVYCTEFTVSFPGCFLC